MIPVALPAGRAGFDVVGGHSEAERFALAYRSPTSPLDNRWDLWTHAGPQPQAVISLRGTAAKAESWLANMYAAMLPAAGELVLGGGRRICVPPGRQPAAGRRARGLAAQPGLHGRRHRTQNGFVLPARHPRLPQSWATARAAAWRSLLTSYLRNLQQQGRLPADLRLKTLLQRRPQARQPLLRLRLRKGAPPTAAGPAGERGEPRRPGARGALTTQTVRDFNSRQPVCGRVRHHQKAEVPEEPAGPPRLPPARRARAPGASGATSATWAATWSQAVAKAARRLPGPCAFYPSSNYVRADGASAAVVGPVGPPGVGRRSIAYQAELRLLRVEVSWGQGQAIH
ncbi:MAG: hypothetical protein WKG07_18790 [Hymenobacter sp.]